MRHFQIVGVGVLGLLFASPLIAGYFDKPLIVKPAAIQPVWDEIEKPKGPIAAPVTLTASDGSGLTLAALEAHAVVSDPLAFTELHLTFDNPRDQTIEGTFAITLPPGASVSRFAMKLGSVWQDGEVVEKQQARRVYEDFLHRKQDPALLEQSAGNTFSARVFPIPARAHKEIILSYSQALAGHMPYTLALRGFPEIGSLDVSVSLGGGGASPIATLVQTKTAPTEDFVLDRTLIRKTSGLRSDNLVLARVEPMPNEALDVIQSAIVLCDTSASRALDFAGELEVVQKIVKDIATRSGAETPLTVAAFDQEVVPIFSGKIVSFGDADLKKLEQRGAMGASNLEKALVWAKTQAVAKRVILVTDGVPTAGETAQEKLRAVAASLKEVGVERVDAVTVGGIRDDALLHELATSGLAHDGVVVDGRLVSAALSRHLNGATRSGIEVKVDNATWVYPTKLDGVQSGDEVFVYADVPTGTPVHVSFGDQSKDFDLEHVDRPLLERAWVQAKIASLLETDQNEQVKQTIVDLSVKHRVTSPYASFLVLETEADYATFGIKRDALADIMTIDHGALVAQKRTAIALGAKDDPKKAAPVVTATAAPAQQLAPTVEPTTIDGTAIGDSFGAGGLGLSGVGEGGGGRGEGIGLGNIGTIGGSGTGSGFGSGHGRLGGAHLVSAPTMRQGQTSVSVGLPPEVVQRIIRQNFGRFRLCYETGLSRNPTVQGRVPVSFTIDQDGRVHNPHAQDADLPDAQVVACVVRAFTNLSFPQPEGVSVVTVTYPIIFSPPEGGPAPPPTAPVVVVDKPKVSDPYTGKLKDVMGALGRHDIPTALDQALTWAREAKGDVLSLVALGEVYEASGDLARAQRAYGSIIDLFASRADLRRFAGARLERIKDPAALDLALDTFLKAEADRPDHPESHRLVAFAWLRKGDYEKAFAAAEAGAKQPYPANRFRGVDRILRDDLGLVAAAWIAKEPNRRAEIEQRRANAGGNAEDKPSLRFVLNWETDANDVDFHIYDDRGGHAYYASKVLPSGGELYADVTTGYGPECFTIRGASRQNYTLQANYYSRGPMGYGMGKLEVIDHDGKGNLKFDERPFVVMVDRAFVDLGTVKH